MKALLMTDIHINRSNIDEILKLTIQVVKICSVKKIKNVMILGDVFDKRTSMNGQSLKVMLAFRDLLKMFQGINVYCIPGNHDKTDLDSEESYISIFSDTENLTIFDGSLPEKSCVVLENVVYWFLPFFLDEKYLHKLSLIRKQVLKMSDKQHVLLTHIAVSGVKNNDGSVVENEIKSTLFSVFDLVMVGHYHNRSKLEKNVIYMGSLFPQDFGEDNSKGVCVIDSKKVDFEFIDLDFPHYLKHIVDNEGDADEILEYYKEAGELTLHKIRIVFAMTAEKFAKINVKRFKVAGIDVKFESSDTGITSSLSDLNSQVMKFDEKTIKSNFLEYCKLNNIKTSAIKRGLGILFDKFKGQ